MLPAQWNPDSDSAATDIPTQAETNAPPQSGAAATQSQPQTISMAAAPRSLSSPVQSVSGKSDTTRTAARDTKQQMPSNPVATPVISNAASVPLPAVAASPSRIPQQDSSAQTVIANPLPTPQQDVPAHAVTASASPLPQQNPASQADPKSASPTADSSEGTNKPQTETTAVPSADAASVRTTPQEFADQLKANPEAAKSGAAQRSPAGDASSANGIAGAAAVAVSNGTAVADAVQSALPVSIAPLPAVGDVFQLPDAGALTKSSAGDPSSKNLSALNGTGDGKDKQSDVASASPNSSAHNSTTNNQAVQRTDATLSHAAPDASKPASSSSSQMQGVAVQGAPRAAEPATARSGALPQPARAGEQEAQAHASETLPTSGLDTAGVVQKMSETEMRVAVHSTDFGAVSIRTSLSEQQMMTQITVDHSDLGRALSAHASAMEDRLGNELGVRALVQVNHSAMSSSGNGGNSHQGGQRNLAASHMSNEIAPEFAESDDPDVDVIANVAGDSRLDIRA